MSTAGKVLSGLVILLSLVWIVLTAGVAELNRNGTDAVDKARTKLADLTAKLKVIEHDIEVVRDKTYHEQLQNDNDVAVLRTQQTELEKARSQVLEISSRVRIALEGMEVTVKNAGKARDDRAAEKVAEIKAKADAEALVETLKGENATSLARLAELRDQFKAALAANKAMVEKLEAKIKTTTGTNPNNNPANGSGPNETE